MNETRQLAEFCSRVSYDRLPAAVRDKVKLCVLDYIANVYGSLELEAVSDVVRFVRAKSSGGPATVLGCGFKCDLLHAALVNGTMGEAVEAQDGLRFGGNHPGTAVIPAALAAAEELGLGGRAVIEAIAAGYEAADRPAAAMHPWHTLGGFLPTGTCGAFGAAAAVGRLKGFPPERLASALGCAGYLLPLSMAEQLMGGFTIKIVQGGMAALSGLLAAGLAEAGLSGAPYVLEGSALGGGFTKITVAPGAAPKNERLVEELGEKWSVLDIYFKPFTACRHTHGAAQAVLELKREHGLRAEDVIEARVAAYGIAQLAVGKGVSEGDAFVSAQFSIPYVVAVCLLDGELGPKQLTEKRLADPAVLELSRRASVATDEELNQRYPAETASRVEIVLKDGRALTRQVNTPLGDPRTPLDAEALSQKVRRFAGDRDMSRVGRAIELALELDHLDDIHELTAAI